MAALEEKRRALIYHGASSTYAKFDITPGRGDDGHKDALQLLSSASLDHNPES